MVVSLYWLGLVGDDEAEEGLGHRALVPGGEGGRGGGGGGGGGGGQGVTTRATHTPHHNARTHVPRGAREAESGGVDL